MSFKNFSYSKIWVRIDKLDFNSTINILSKNTSDVKIYDIPISIKDVYYGKRIKLRIPVKRICDKCNGLGYKIKDEVCNICYGTGKLKIETNLGFAKILESFTCPSCYGTGHLVEKCDCDNGKIIEYEDIEYQIPQGIENNELVLIKRYSKLNPAVYIRVLINEDMFKIQNLDLIKYVELTKEQLINNHLIIIQHPLRIFKFYPRELIKTKRITIKGYGLINRRKQCGDLIIESKIQG